MSFFIVGIGALLLGIKWLGPKAEHSSPCSAEGRMCGAKFIHVLNHMPLWHAQGQCLVPFTLMDFLEYMIVIH
jgi:hypothetical protein